MVSLIHCGRHGATLTAEGDRFTIELNEWFRVRRHAWDLKDLKSLAVNGRKVSDGDSGTKTIITLRVEPRHGKALDLLRYRQKSELEWVATTFRKYLHLSS